MGVMIRFVLEIVRDGLSGVGVVEGRCVFVSIEMLYREWRLDQIYT